MVNVDYQNVGRNIFFGQLGMADVAQLHGDLLRLNKRGHPGLCSLDLANQGTANRPTYHLPTKRGGK